MIAGSGRSGTTWVLDALAFANRLRPVFEPLNPYVSRVGSTYAHRAISVEEKHPELLEFFRGACAGREARLWTQYRQQRRWLLPPFDRLRSREDFARLWKVWEKFLSEAPRLATMSLRSEALVKCIWSNLMLEWLARNLPCVVAVIVRHPGAVIESELRTGWNPNYAIERFRNDLRLRELTGGRYESLLNKTLSPVEALTVRWVIENQQSIEMATTDKITVHHYESLKSMTIEAWKGLASALGLTRVPDRQVLEKPSQQSAPMDSEAAGSDSTVPGWMSRLTSQDKAAVQRVLDSTNMEVYSMDSVHPRVPGKRMADVDPALREAP
jgi:hypothetical protein